MKIAGSYGSLIRGVSQQAPEVRQDGQHTEQVNMLSDPVAGLTRRRGTIFKASQLVTGMAGAAINTAIGTFAGYREIEHSAGGKDYVILMRDQTSGQASNVSLPPVMAYDRTSNAWLNVSWPSTPQADKLNSNGVSATVSVGAYLLFGVNGLPCVSTSTQVYKTYDHTKVIIWIRGGAFNRTYKVRLPNGVTGQYTTPDASAAGANLAITPASIAQGLAATIGAITALVGSHIVIEYAPGALPTGDISVSDGGDGSLIRGIYDTVDSVDKLPPMAMDGQMVKVQTAPDSWFYVQSYTKGGAAAGLAETIWREAAGTVQGSTVYGLGRARVVGNTLYIGYSEAGNPDGLSHMPAQTTPVPQVVPSVSGDAVSSPPPKWMNGQINFMAMFQDRLLVSCGSEVAVSGAGDYLNFFRSTVTTVPANDGFAMVAQGGEDDIARIGVTYNRNLVIFGDKRQYLISGTTPLTPTSANMTIMTVYPGAAECRPVAAGGQIFYARNREGSVGVHQIQPGQYVESAESFPASAQTGTYIPAPASVMEPVPGAPALLVVRSRSQPNGLYVFSYLDQPDGRKQDAWSRWEFSPLCGKLIGVKNTPNGLLLFWARQIGTSLFIVADLMPMSTAASPLPYLDSMRLNDGLVGVGTAEAGWSIAFDNQSSRYMIGGDWVNDRIALASAVSAYESQTQMWVGLPFDSYVVPTNPYARDQQKRAILTGRTVVTAIKASVRASSGLSWVLSSGGTDKPGSFNGRVLGDANNKVGTVPISDTIVSIPIGRDNRAYTLTIKARKWLPLNLIGLEWTGQSFNRTPRA